MKTVRLVNTSDDIKIQISGRMISENKNVEVAWEFEDDEYPYNTLRDLSIIMYSMMGQGVMWHLAYELSKKFSVTPLEFANAISEITKEYSKLSEEEVYSIRETQVPDSKYFNQIVE